MRLRLLFAIATTLLSTISCNKPFSELPPLDLSKLKACLKTENECLFVMSIATKNIKEESYAEYVRGLKRFDYNFQILGNQLDWEGWITRGRAMKSALIQLENSFTPVELNKIIVVTSDTGDVLVQRDPQYLLQKYKNKTDEIKNKFPKLKSNDLVIVGGEANCGSNCDPNIYKWYDKLNIPQTERIFPYVQGGFLMGPVLAMKRFYSYTVEHMSNITNDDQIAMAGFALENPEHIYIDYHQEIAATIVEFGQNNPNAPPAIGLNYDWNQAYQFAPLGLALGEEIQKRIGSDEKIYPIFIHLPNNQRERAASHYWKRLVDHVRATAWQ